MYIYCQKTGKYEYVVLKQSIYIGGKTVTKIIKKFGRRDRPVFNTLTKKMLSKPQ